MGMDIKKALYFATEKHDGQYRKGSGRVPYIAHPVQVAFIVSTYTKDAEVIAAAFLHDVIEDCPNVSVNLLRKEFGNKIAQLVDEVSFIKNKKYATWKDGKKEQLLKIKKASKNALLIIAVDKMVNLQSYFDAIKKKGDGVVKLDFHGTPDEYHWFYTEVGKILTSLIGEHLVVKDYNKIYKSYQK